jgi:NAD(P)-dependent dehydrogenase (short-subunit alcohol dehydrogenase family)
MPIVLVTGATDGIGRETARELARRGARVIVHGRRADKAEAVKKEVEALSGAAMPAALIGDLSSFAGVRAMAESLLARGEGIDVLLNNAGIYMNEAATSHDGFELTFAVNHLAPFLLTHLLLPRLRESAGPRVVNVSSMAHARGQLSVAGLGSLGSTKGFEPYAAYALSKLANVLFTVELARRLGPSVAVSALHPGVVSTKLLTEGFGMRGSDSLAEGAATSVRLALAPELAQVSGRYFSHGREAPMAGAARDPALVRAFYETSCELTGIAPLPERV